MRRLVQIMKSVEQKDSTTAGRQAGIFDPDPHCDFSKP